MNAPQRYVMTRFAGDLSLAADGDLVLFADIEPALRDAERLAWLMPVIDGSEDSTAIARAQALAIGLGLGLSGCELVDFARERCSA